ncbi:predicted protein [Coccidioides posadasii str. Silveira]|uniref:Predicted protein n=2 Tax=Coccidioides posadasii TaxID=199306 RepID=E9DCN5_COCPS|nr:predicted protein [Coccidioides posadasii str. Silveira]KMM69272.1 hypothetical protein CPAG_05592 [Coccidioides posadasii RMSCC 3488]
MPSNPFPSEGCLSIILCFKILEPKQTTLLLFIHKFGILDQSWCLSFGRIHIWYDIRDSENTAGTSENGIPLFGCTAHITHHTGLYHTSTGETYIIDKNTVLANPFLY